MIAPIVKPINTKEYDFKESKYEVAPRLPFSQTITGPSGSGKGTLLQSTFTKMFLKEFPFGLLLFQLTVIGCRLKNTFRII